MGEGIAVLFEAVARAEHRCDGHLGGGLDGELEAVAPSAVGERLGAVRVGADQFGLAVPQAGQVECHLGGHAEDHDAAPGPGDRERVGKRLRGSNGIDGGMCSTAERRTDQV